MSVDGPLESNLCEKRAQPEFDLGLVFPRHRDQVLGVMLHSAAHIGHHPGVLDGGAGDIVVIARLIPHHQPRLLLADLVLVEFQLRPPVREYVLVSLQDTLHSDGHQDVPVVAHKPALVYLLDLSRCSEDHMGRQSHLLLLASLEELQTIVQLQGFLHARDKAGASQHLQVWLGQCIIVRWTGGAHGYIHCRSLLLNDVTQSSYILIGVVGRGPRHHIELIHCRGEAGQTEEALELEDYHSGTGAVEVPGQMKALNGTAAAQQDGLLPLDGTEFLLTAQEPLHQGNGHPQELPEYPKQGGKPETGRRYRERNVQDVSEDGQQESH